MKRVNKNKLEDSSQKCKLFEITRTKLREFCCRHNFIFHWAMHFDLPHVSVPALLMVLNHRDLNHESPHQLLIEISERDHYPTARLLQVLHFYLLKIVKVGPHPH